MAQRKKSADSRGPQKRSRQQRKEARPAELAAVALEVFNEKGFAAATLDEVAARAGVSKGTLYLYFENKEALFEGVIRNTIPSALLELHGTRNEAVQSNADRLRGILQLWTHVLSDSPLAKLPKLVVSDIDKFPRLADAFHCEVVAPHRAMLREIVSDGIRQGEFRNENPAVLTELILNALWMPAIARDSGAFFPDGDPAETGYFQALPELILRSLRPDKAPP